MTFTVCIATESSSENKNYSCHLLLTVAATLEDSFPSSGLFQNGNIYHVITSYHLVQLLNENHPALYVAVEGQSNTVNVHMQIFAAKA